MEKKRQTTREKTSSTSKEAPLLIVGDWVVDDNWNTGVYRSSTSLRTGRHHFRSLHHPQAPVQSFCGAGRLASILSDGGFPVIGLGVWHYDQPSNADDTEMLKSLFDFEYRRKCSPHSLRTEPNSDLQSNGGVELINLASYLSAQTWHDNQKYETTRILRLFQQSDEDLSLISRTDWEQPPNNQDSDGSPAWVTSDDHDGIRTFLERQLKGKEPKAVILKDLIKGVVSETLVDVLVEIYGNVPWFVSTKRWAPSWLERLKQVPLRLLCVPPIASSAAIEKESGLDSWLAAGRAEPTKEALKCISDLENGHHQVDKDNNKIDWDHPMIVIAPETGQVLAKRGGYGFATIQQPPASAQFVGWATAFFSALVGVLIKEEEKERQPVASPVMHALDYASRWAESEAKLLREPENGNPKRPLSLKDFVPSMNEADISIAMNEEFNWEKKIDEWNEATQVPGIIDQHKSGRLELWRGMTSIEGYICFETQKRKDLSRLVREFRQFSEGLERHESVEIHADPGSGKTHLVECLAKASKLRMESFNITQMNSREDIISCFDTIVTRQATERDRPLLVFIDEINARIDGNPVYDAFLTPLADNVYVRGGLKFHIQPCVWIFVGTGEADMEDPSVKYKDFEDRLSLGKVSLQNITDLEKYYLAAQLVRLRFPDVQKISVAALTALSQRGGSVRELKNLISHLHDVQNGRVTIANIPGNESRPDSNYVSIAHF